MALEDTPSVSVFIHKLNADPLGSYIISVFQPDRLTLRSLEPQEPKTAKWHCCCVVLLAITHTLKEQEQKEFLVFKAVHHLLTLLMLQADALLEFYQFACSCHQSTLLLQIVLHHCHNAFIKLLKSAEFLSSAFVEKYGVEFTSSSIMLLCEFYPK